MSGSYGVGNERYSRRTRGDEGFDAFLRLALRPGPRSLLVSWLARSPEERAAFVDVLAPGCVLFPLFHACERSH